MEPALSAPPDALALLLKRAATTLPSTALELVFRDLSVPELARLACVHKAFRKTWTSLRQQHPGSRYEPPTDIIVFVNRGVGRLERAAAFGDDALSRRCWLPAWTTTARRCCRPAPVTGGAR